MKAREKSFNVLEPYDDVISIFFKKGPTKMKSGATEKLLNVLMVAEKPSIARSIARALSTRYSKNRFETRSKKTSPVPIFEVTGMLFDKPALLKITSVQGHLYGVSFDRGFSPWRAKNALEVFSASIRKQFSNENAEKVAKNLEVEAKRCSYLLLWLDNDREGENISFEVKDICEPHLKKEKFEQILRAKFSSTADADILKAFDEMKDGPNSNESSAVDARQVLDLKIGVAFSTFQSKYLSRNFEKMSGKLISYGPCQTPTLGFCVQRDDEVKEFNSKKFYRVVVKVAGADGELIELASAEGRNEEKDEAEELQKMLIARGQLEVSDVSAKEHTKGHPEALNTVNMLKLASTEIELSPDEALKVAERLYLSGFITYPRTETTSYPENFNFEETAQSLRKFSEVRELCDYIQENGVSSPKKGKDAGDHPPITPTSKVPREDSLSAHELALYKLVSRQYLATIMPDAKYTKQQVKFTCGEHEFTLNGTVVTNTGFMDAVPWVKISGSKIPEFKLDSTHKIATVEVKEGKTSPPDHLTESDLLSLMEKNGIGTDASMAGHINTICERKYVKVLAKSRKLVPTLLGRSLVHCYDKIDPDLVAPDLRAKMEKSLDNIAKGLSQRREVENDILNAFKEKFVTFTQKMPEMKPMFQEMSDNLQADDFQDRKRHEPDSSKDKAPNAGKNTKESQKLQSSEKSTTMEEGVKEEPEEKPKKETKTKKEPRAKKEAKPKKVEADEKPKKEAKTKKEPKTKKVEAPMETDSVDLRTKITALSSKK